MSKIVQKFNEVKCKITTARVRGINAIIPKKHNGDLKEAMLQVVIVFGVFAIVSVCIYAIVTNGSTWANSKAAETFK